MIFYFFNFHLQKLHCLFGLRKNLHRFLYLKPKSKHVDVYQQFLKDDSENIFKSSFRMCLSAGTIGDEFRINLSDGLDNNK